MRQLAIVFAAFFAFIIVGTYGTPSIREDFDAMGYFNNGSPNWFMKPTYNMNEWLVNVYPDRIQPSCLPYSVTAKYGLNDTKMLNYYSQAYQFWRM